MAEHDAIVVGSGVNGLACAALLARAGWDVCVLERNDWFGGAIRTAEITAPGYVHDVFSAWHPLWVGGAAHAQLGADLARHGLDYLNTELPTGTLFPHGLLAPWVRHTGLGPEAAGSGYMAQVIAVAVQEGGMPIPHGGGAKLAEALVSYIREQGGTCETGVDVKRVFTGGVRTADGAA